MHLLRTAIFRDFSDLLYNTEFEELVKRIIADIAESRYSESRFGKADRSKRDGAKHLHTIAPHHFGPHRFAPHHIYVTCTCPYSSLASICQVSRYLEKNVPGTQNNYVKF